MTLNTDAKWHQIALPLDKQHHKYVIIHETDGPEDQTVEEIDNFHKNVNHWSGVGYHRLIRNTGQIHTGRPDDVVGAQAAGLNSWSIGCAYIGQFGKKLPGDVQRKAMVHCVAVECLRWGIPVKNIIGHRDVAKLVGDPSVATECPGDPIWSDLPKFRADVIHEMEKIQKGGN